MKKSAAQRKHGLYCPIWCARVPYGAKSVLYGALYRKGNEKQDQIGSEQKGIKGNDKQQKMGCIEK